MGRQCEVYCKVCMKTMRSDILLRHMKQHENKSKREENISQNIKTINSKEMDIKCEHETRSLI